MRKRMKRCIAALLAAALVCSLGFSVLAESGSIQRSTFCKNVAALKIGRPRFLVGYTQCFNFKGVEAQRNLRQIL